MEESYISGLEGIGLQTKDTQQQPEVKVVLKDFNAAENQTKDNRDNAVSNKLNQRSAKIIDLENNQVIEIKNAKLKPQHKVHTKYPSKEFKLKNKTNKCSEFKSTTEGS